VLAVTLKQNNVNMRPELLETLTNWKEEEENKVGVRRITYSLFPDGEGE
jgi:hypothetical protein